jgi:hypothetical protein
MKTLRRAFVLALSLCLPFGGVHAAEFRSALDKYEAEVSALISQEQDLAVKEYLEGRLADARTLDASEQGNPELPVKLAELVQKRITVRPSPTIRHSPAAIAEEQVYGRELARYIGEDYINLVKLQDELLSRKYFKTETAQNANFIEGVINGYWKLTRADQGDPKKILLEEPTLGVKPWEAIFRFEPTIAMRNGPQAAVIGTAGLSYTFFPAVNRSGPSVKFDETFSSKVVKKSGGRIGVGAARFGSSTHLLVGSGLQVNALGVWCLYDPRERKFMLGLSTADLSKLQKYLGWFN